MAAFILTWRTRMFKENTLGCPRHLPFSLNRNITYELEYIHNLLVATLGKCQGGSRRIM